MESKSAFSRRQFMELLGVSAAGFGLVSMAGCGGGDDAKKDEGADAPAGGGAADTITYSLTADPRAVDPAYFDDGESAVVSCNMYEGLYQYGKTDAKVSPCLAKDLPEISDDGLVYTIKLNEGIKFHDGTDFNAEAVKKSIERQLEPNRNSDMPYASFVFGEEEAGNGVETVEAVDDYTVKITMRAASAPFVKNLAMALASPIVAPSAIEAATDGQAITNPVGTGPYKFVDWTKGASVTLVANEDYWGEAPKTKNLVFKIIAEGNTRLTSLINGECDIISSVDPASADQIVDNGFELFSEDGMTINYMAFNTETGKCTDQEVRKAVAQAINVEEMVKSIYGEYATVANSVMPTWMAPYAKDVKQTAYDPEAAKKTLADKGITSLQCITYTTARPYNQKGGSDLANMIQGYLSAVGVDAEHHAVRLDHLQDQGADGPVRHLLLRLDGRQRRPGQLHEPARRHELVHERGPLPGRRVQGAHRRGPEDPRWRRARRHLPAVRGNGCREAAVGAHLPLQEPAGLQPEGQGLLLPSDGSRVLQGRLEGSVKAVPRRPRGRRVFPVRPARRILVACGPHLRYTVIRS